MDEYREPLGAPDITVALGAEPLQVGTSRTNKMSLAALDISMALDEESPGGETRPCGEPVALE